MASLTSIFTAFSVISTNFVIINTSLLLHVVSPASEISPELLLTKQKLLIEQLHKQSHLTISRYRHLANFELQLHPIHVALL